MVYRDDKEKNYTIISNKYLRDTNLSLKAKGLLTLMLSLPDNWIYSTIGLSMITKESKNTIHSILHELEKFNYLVRKKIRNNKGKFLYWNYDIFESPYHNNRDMDNLDMENCDINKITNNENTNYKDKLDKTQLNNITLELIRRNFITIDSLDIVRYNELFNSIINNYDYNTILIAVNYVISRMKDKTIDEEGQPILQTFKYFKSSLINNLNKLTDDTELFDDIV